MAKIAGQLKGGKENMRKADVRKGLEDGLAMRLPLSEPREIYKDSLETDNRSSISSEFNFEIDLPGKRDRSTIYRLNLIKLDHRKPELANLVMENSSEGIVKDSEILYSSLVYADKRQTLDHLEDNIRRVIADIRPQMLEKVIENWTSRLDYSLGSPMPDIIFKM
ncbi:uncharacterized protein TNCV_2282831 [Trichonephila clavipes]|nr:uncharacterized protein TNCV_2282831 [Trichonephila clavipes]